MESLKELDRASAVWFDAHVVNRMTKKIELDLVKAISEQRKAANRLQETEKRLIKKKT